MFLTPTSKWLLCCLSLFVTFCPVHAEAEPDEALPEEVQEAQQKFLKLIDENSQRENEVIAQFKKKVLGKLIAKMKKMQKSGKVREAVAIKERIETVKTADGLTLIEGDPSYDYYQKKLADLKKQKAEKDLKDVERYINYLKKKTAATTKSGNLELGLAFDAELKRMEDVHKSMVEAKKTAAEDLRNVVARINDPFRGSRTAKTATTTPKKKKSKPEKDMDLATVYKELDLNENGFNLNDSSIIGSIENSALIPILSTKKRLFNGTCEYSFKVKGRWYYGATLKIDDKEYSMSVGHWANAGTRIIVGDDEIKLKGTEFRVSKDEAEDWNEVQIKITKDSIEYLYNGKKVYDADVSIPANTKLQWGVTFYRSELELKDFELKL